MLPKMPIRVVGRKSRDLGARGILVSPGLASFSRPRSCRN